MNIPFNSKFEMSYDFKVGKLYNRQKEIHGIYGGNRQSGISVSKNFPYIFLFTGSSGGGFGYSDTIEGKVVNYFGEGQVGDMIFSRGNSAIVDHVHNGKDLLLFESTGKGKPVRFLGEFICQSYEEVEAKDRNDNNRKAIVFQLEAVDGDNHSSEISVPQDLLKKSLGDLRRKAYNSSGVPKKVNGSNILTKFDRSIDVKAYALKRANGICECCGAKAPFNDKNGQPYLEVHHITKLSDNGLDSPENVAAITPNCHSEIHYGVNGSTINKALAKKILELEKGLSDG